MEINILFIIVAIALIVSSVWGYKRGFLESVIRIISCILGIMVFVVLAKGIGSAIQGSLWSVIMAVILLIVIRVIHKIIKLVINSLKIMRAFTIGRIADKLAGAVVGLAEGLVVIWLLFILIGSLNMFNLNTWITAQVAQNSFLSLIYDTNYIVMLFR